MHYFSYLGGTNMDSTKSAGTRYGEIVFLHPVKFVGHIVHSGTSGEQNIDTLFFLIASARVVFIKRVLGHVTPNLCFCIWWDLRVT
jgi:hypothetical protein